jgi:hypothetical protein
MAGLEKMTDEQFYELTHHDEHHDSSVKVAQH